MVGKKSLKITSSMLIAAIASGVCNSSLVFAKNVDEGENRESFISTLFKSGVSDSHGLARGLVTVPMIFYPVVLAFLYALYRYGCDKDSEFDDDNLEKKELDEIETGIDMEDALDTENVYLLDREDMCWLLQNTLSYKDKEYKELVNRIKK